MRFLGSRLLGGVGFWISTAIVLAAAIFVILSVVLVLSTSEGIDGPGAEANAEEFLPATVSHVDMFLWVWAFYLCHLWLLVVGYGCARDRSLIREKRVAVLIGIAAVVLVSGHLVGLWAVRNGVSIGGLPLS